MKHVKKILSIILVVIMLLSIAPIAMAAEGEAEPEIFTEGIYSYSVADGEATIVDCDSSVSGDVVIPNTLGGYPVAAIGYMAFYYSPNITSVVIPTGVKTIGDFAFFGNTGLTELVLPDGVVSLGEHAFARCSAIKSVSIPKTLTDIDAAAFALCGAIERFAVDAENTAFSADEGGVLYNKDKTQLLLYTPGNTQATYTVPAGVKSLAYGAFNDAVNLESIVLPESLIEIENEVFLGCTKLKSIVIPNSVTSIGDSAFYYCLELTDITLPENLTKISAGMFYGCISLESVTIPSKVTEIGSYAFSYTAALKDITIPSNVKTIADFAFQLAQSLENITIENGVEAIGNYAFEYCDALKSISISSSVKSIGKNAFSNSKKLTDVYFDGTKQEWNSIEINNENEGNKYLLEAEIHCLQESHVHEFTQVSYYQEEHPHYAVYKCECDEEQVSEETQKKDECEECYPHEHNYNSGTYYQTEHPHYAVYRCECGVEKVSAEPHKSLECIDCQSVYASSIVIVSKPSTLNYVYKSSVSRDGLKVIAKYKNGSEKDVTDEVDIYDFNTSIVGRRTATVRFDDATATFEYTVKYTWWQWIIRIILLGFLWY